MYSQEPEQVRVNYIPVGKTTPILAHNTVVPSNCSKDQMRWCNPH